MWGVRGGPNLGWRSAGFHSLEVLERGERCAVRIEHKRATSEREMQMPGTCRGQRECSGGARMPPTAHASVLCVHFPSACVASLAGYGALEKQYEGCFLATLAGHWVSRTWTFWPDRRPFLPQPLCGTLSGCSS